MKLITIFGKIKTLHPCPKCGALVELDEWIVIPKGKIRKEDYILIAIKCSKNCLRTEYWPFEKQAIYQWGRICDEYNNS